MCYTVGMQTAILILILAILTLADILVIFVLKKKPFRVYRPKGNVLLSIGEKRFYDALSTAMQGRPYLIFAKVRIADLIEAKLERSDPNFWKQQGPINQKHLDYILVDRVDTRPILAIELDGGSHNDPERARRDAFIDSVFQSAGIPMLHIPVKNFYPYHDLRLLVETTIIQRAGS